MQAFLESAEINASDAWTLFASLDVDGDNVTWKSNERSVFPWREGVQISNVVGCSKNLCKKRVV